MKHYKSHIKTMDSITIVFDEGDPAVITKDNPSFAQIATLLRERMFDEIPAAADIAIKVEERTKGRFKIEKESGVAIFKDEELPPSLSDRLLQLVNQKLDTKPLERFWRNLKHNPSTESRKDLYDFLTHNKVPITDDGCFIAYKSVTSDYLDHQTRKFNNKPGSIVKMPRAEVDPNRNNVCSTGLHVAAYKYAWGFGEGRLVEVKVNPEDVVAVPSDYNQQKMRVCQYEVLADSKNGERQEPLVDTKSNELVFDSRGRLQISLKTIAEAGLGKAKSLAIRVDKRCPDEVRVGLYNGRGTEVKPTRLGIYVPKELINEAGIKSNRLSYRIKDGVLVLKGC